jgi:hypothetical protein
MIILTEESEIYYKNISQLSYENKDEVVELFVDDFYVGDLKVFLDSEMEEREYITINYEIIYLDSLTLRK